MQPVFAEQLHNRLAVLTFGALQVSFGILLVLLDILAFIVDGQKCVTGPKMHAVGGSGIWAGGFFILTGSLGIVAGEHIHSEAGPRSRRCHLIASLLLSVLGFLLVIVLIPLSLLAATLDPCSLLEAAVSTAVGVVTGTKVDVEPIIKNIIMAGSKVAVAHAVAFGLLLVINFGQIVSASVNIHKLPPRIVSVTYNMKTTNGVSDHHGVATAVHTHPPVMHLP